MTLLLSSLAVLVGSLAACVADDPTAGANAQRLVDAVQQAGLAPELTVDVAEALYGSDASAVCDVFEGGLDSVERLLLLGNPSNRRPKTITDHSVEYSRIVVDIYCPELSAELRDVVDDLDALASDRLEKRRS